MSTNIDPYVRGIDDTFIEDLKNGRLKGFLSLVKSDPNLCLEIRKNYINLYYRGGNAAKISFLRRSNKYRIDFDEKYCLNKDDDSMLHYIQGIDKYNPGNFLKEFGIIRHEMDTWLDVHKNAERDFQHNLIKQNQGSFRIIDIEYAGQTSSGAKFRIDMIGIYSGPDGDKLVLIENKYGDKIGGSSSLLKHFNDILAIINDVNTYSQLIQSVNNTVRNKVELGLVNWKVDVFDKCDVEVLFLLADYSKDVDYVRNHMNGVAYSIPLKVLILPSTTTKQPVVIDYPKAITI